MKKLARVRMTNPGEVTIRPGQTLNVSLNGKVKVELRVTPFGQPEIFCDYNHIVRLFRDWYELNETC
jgi:hypothetical protein